MDDLTRNLLHAINTSDAAGIDRLVTEITTRDTKRQKKLNSNGSLKPAAEWYIAQNLPIFPCFKKGKSPLIPSAHAGEPTRNVCRGECGKLGHGLYDATTEAEKIRRWWTRNPYANIGVPTGIYFDVIDIDGPEGYKWFAEMRTAKLIPPILGRAITPSGGMHLFVPPSGSGNGTGLVPEVDYRGEGGYVLLAPSYVVEDKKGYQGRYVWTERPRFKKLIKGRVAV